MDSTRRSQLGGKPSALSRSAVLATMAGMAAIAGMVSARQTGAESRLAALPIEVPAPADNPTTPDRVALGRLLFWDPILSGQHDVACATCHHPDFGYSDGLDLSIGTHGVGLGATRRFPTGDTRHPVKRNSQSVLNAAFNGLTGGAHAGPEAAPMFWDVRVRSLEAQALEPIKAIDEMRGDAYSEDRALSTVVARLDANAEYRRLFAKTFGGTQPVNEQNLGRALAAFERTLVASNSPFDRYMRGDSAALTPEQLRGMERFQSIGCVNCHDGPMFSDFMPHVLAVPDNPKLPASDTGVTQSYAFRTPSLRNLGVTAPYMHNGVFATLPQVVNFYQAISFAGRGFGGGRGGAGRFAGAGRGGRGLAGARGLNPQVARDQIDPLARNLNLRGPVQSDLLAFLHALDDPAFDRSVPDRVPSGLRVGGAIR